MASRVAIYPTGDGTIAVLVPGHELTVEEAAARFIPRGLPYLLIPESEIPATAEYRRAWTADFSTPDGHGEADE